MAPVTVDDVFPILAPAARSLQRQFDDKPGGGFADVSESGDVAVEDTDGDGQPDEWNNRYLQGETSRTLWDTAFSYQGELNGEEDTVDLLGPTVGGVTDAVSNVDGETTGPEERKGQLLILGVVAVVLLVLLRPLFEIVAEGVQ